MPQDNKLLSLSALVALVEKRRRQGEQLVFTNGCFDLLHWGHVRYLTAARRLGDYLVVGLNSDGSVRELKGEGRPLFSEEHRGELLAGLAAVDFVTIFSSRTAEELVARLKPEVYVKGGDYRDLGAVPEAEQVLALGGRVEFLSGDEFASTTRILAALKNGEGCL